MIAVRVGLVAITLAVSAWFVLGVRQAHGVDHATAILENATKLSTRQAADARSALDEAATLNPDLEVAILRARLALETGHRLEAVRILRNVVHREPQNVAAWLSLARVVLTVPELTSVLHHIQAIEPTVPFPH